MARYRTKVELVEAMQFKGLVDGKFEPEFEAFIQDSDVGPGLVYGDYVVKKDYRTLVMSQNNFESSFEEVL